MFNFSKTDKSLVAFVSVGSKTREMCANALVLIPGLTEGFMSMAYTVELAKALEEIDYSLVQVQISSSFKQFGFSSIEKDSEELTVLIAFLKEELKLKKVVLLGHSTGAQDAVYFIGHSPASKMVDTVILQGAVGDRDIINAYPSMLKSLDEAKRLREKGKIDSFLQDYMYDAPITAKRLLSLGERLTNEDIFSVDLTEEELTSILRGVQVPIMLCFSLADESVPDHSAQKELADRLVKVLKRNSSVVECKYYDGDHGLTEEAMYKPFVKDLVTFLKSISQIIHPLPLKS